MTSPIWRCSSVGGPEPAGQGGRQAARRLIVESVEQPHGIERAGEWIAAANAALELYGDHRRSRSPTWPPKSRPRSGCCARSTELAVHATERETAYRWVDPAGLARSLPGLADIGGPASSPSWATPPASRPANSSGPSPGLSPKASETGDTDRKGQPCPRPGRRCCAPRSCRRRHARKQDPQLARIYYVQMVERGKNHLGALCVVAANLAERAWTVMKRDMPYVICDTDGAPVTPDEAAAIIAEHCTVPAEVRARRRNKKTGKAPQAARTETQQRGDLPHTASSPARLDPSTKSTTNMLDTRSRIGNQNARSGAVMASAERQQMACDVASRCSRGSRLPLSSGSLLVSYPRPVIARDVPHPTEAADALTVGVSGCFVAGVAMQRLAVVGDLHTTIH